MIFNVLWFQKQTHTWVRWFNIVYPNVYIYRSKEDVNNNNNNGTWSNSVPTFSDLPSCLLELILSFLLLKDNISASAVCKAWRTAAEYVRVVEKHPWVIYIPLCGTLIDLFDPLPWKRYTLNLPEMDGSFVCYSKDGWLLMRRTNLVDLFFFNPYTRELITLPKYNSQFQKIAFSSAPTSGTCVSVTLNFSLKYLLSIRICYPGATEWITMEFPFSLDFDPFRHSNLIYANDHFFYFTGGILFEFDPATRTLNHQAWDEYRRPHGRFFYLMEQKGELFLMYACGSVTPKVYKLSSSKWEEISSATFDGLTIFASRYSSVTRMDVLGLRNSVYLAKYGSYGMQCEFYSFREGRLLKPLIVSQMLDEPNFVEGLWIEPPPCKDVLDFKLRKGKAKVTIALWGFVIVLYMHWSLHVRKHKDYTFKLWHSEMWNFSICLNFKLLYYFVIWWFSDNSLCLYKAPQCLFWYVKGVYIIE